MRSNIRVCLLSKFEGAAYHVEEGREGGMVAKCRVSWDGRSVGWLLVQVLSQEASKMNHGTQLTSFLFCWDSSPWDGVIHTQSGISFLT